MFKLREITKVLREGVQVTVHEATNNDLYASKTMYKKLHDDAEESNLATLKSNFLYMCVRTSTAEGIPFELPTILDTREELDKKFNEFMTLPEKLTDEWSDACFNISAGEKSADPKLLRSQEVDSSNTSQQQSKNE